MNAGIIASRYAKAFLEYVREAGTGKEVYSQAWVLVHLMNELPQLKAHVENPSDISVERKVALISAALNSPPDDSLVRLLKMVTVRRRMEYFFRILLSFIEQYRQENNIKVGLIVTASHNEGLCDRLEHIFHDKTGAEVHLEERIDPEMLGGFVFELEGLRLDASVKGHIERIRRQLVEKNSRLV